MKKYHVYYDSIPQIADCVACIGNFDGVHRGHQSLISKTVELAKKNGCSSAAIVFTPDPADVIRKEKLFHLTTFTQREILFERFGIDFLIVIHFDERVMNLGAKEFTERFLKTFHLKTLVCGFDYTYGYKGKGNTDTLRKEGKDSFELCVVEEVKFYGKKISSTRLKEVYESGNMKYLDRMLGYDYRKLKENESDI